MTTRNLGTRELVVSLWKCVLFTIPCSPRHFWPKIIWLFSLVILLTWFDTLRLAKWNIKLKGKVRQDLQDPRRNAVDAEHPPRTWLPRWIWKMAESLGQVFTYGWAIIRWYGDLQEKKSIWDYQFKKSLIATCMHIKLLKASERCLAHLTYNNKTNLLYSSFKMST